MRPRARVGRIDRHTRETRIAMRLNLDGRGTARVDTSIPFLDHMLELFAKHGRFDLTVRASGDRHIDDHHLVEDLGIVLGEALAQALGDKRGLVRFGNFLLPMDEALSYVALDLSGRPYFVYRVKWIQPRIGRFDGLLLEHFFQSFAHSARMNLHMALRYGRHPHHVAESLFKGLGRALAQAVRRDPRVAGVPSTKGRL